MFAKILPCCLLYIILTSVRWKICQANHKNLDEHILSQAERASSVVHNVTDISIVSPTNVQNQSIPANTDTPDISKIIPMTRVGILSSQYDSNLEVSEKVGTRFPYNSDIQSTNDQVQSVPFKLTDHTSLIPDAHLLPNMNSKSDRMLNNLKALPPDIITTSPINTIANNDGNLAIRATPVMPNSRMASIHSIEGLESNASIERDITAVPNHTRSILQTNGTSSVRVERRTNSHTMVIVPAVIGVISVLSIGVMAALYQWHQRGRRRKVYLSHPGAPPKDFAEDTGVRSPVLLPEEIEMQVGRSQSLRVRRAVILATDSLAVETESPSASNADNLAPDTSDDSAATNASTPPPPPYREPPPYLPDMVIENIHAL